MADTNAGMIWVDGGEAGTGQWVPNPYASLNNQPAPAANPVAGPNAAINANWQMSQPLQNQFAQLLTNPVSGYSPNANYGARLGRFQFSATAPVPQTAPVGWGRWPGVDGSPPSAPWLAGQTAPPPKWGSYTPPVATPPPNTVGGPGWTQPPTTGGGTTPPTPVTPPTTGTGGPPPGGTYNPTGAWSGSGLGPSSQAAHAAMLASRQSAAQAAAAAMPVAPPVSNAAALSAIGQSNANLWAAPATNKYGAPGSGLQWSPGDFASPAAGSWQANWNALPPALRVAYSQALSGGTSGSLARQIYEAEGASPADGANLVNSMAKNGVLYKIEGGQLVQYAKDSTGRHQKTVLATLLNKNAPTYVKGL